MVFIFAALLLIAGWALAFVMAYADYMRTAPSGTTSPLWVAGITFILATLLASTHWW